MSYIRKKKITHNQIGMWKKKRENHGQTQYSSVDSLIENE